MDLVKVLAEQQIKNDLPELKVGATVKVHAEDQGRQPRKNSDISRVPSSLSSTPASTSL